MKLAVGNSRTDKKWKNRDISWDEFLARVSMPVRTTETVEEYRKLKKGQQDPIKDVGGFVGGHLREGRRKNGNVLCRSMLTLDMDYGKPGVWDQITLLESWRCCVYSTHKHTPEYPRLRLIIPLAREVSEDEYPALGRMVAQKIGIDLFDDTTYEPCRLMYWPSAPANGEFVFEQQDGGLLNPDEYLSMYADWRDASTWPTSSRQSEAVHKLAAQQADPLAKEGVVGVFCRAYTAEEAIEAFLSDVYAPSVMNGRYDYIPADSSAGVVTYDGKFAYSHHATDPACGKLLNAFDQVRIHKYAALDDKASFKLITTAVSAGGGMKGVLAACGSLLGPVGIAAVAAAALYGAYRWIDYASGAAEAREALQGMSETAKAWSEQQATTVFDSGNDAFARFNLTPDSFGGIEESKDWLTRLNATWTDGKQETSEIVNAYVDEFKADSDQLRQAVEERQKILSGLGVKDTRSDEVLKRLDAYDKEVQALLKKRQNGTLNEKDQARLQEIVTQRVQIKLEYALGESGGYEQILQGVEAEKARLEAEGGSASIDLYADAMKAAAQGSAEYNAALEETYASEYKVIAAMQDGADKQAALDALNEQHNQAKLEGARKYAEVLSQLVGPMLTSDELGGADEKLQKLVGLLSEFQIASSQGGNTSGILTQLDELTKGMDEGELASYLAILTQIQDAVKQGGLTPEETQKLFPDLNITDVLGGYTSIADFLKANSGSFEGLSTMFNEALPDEVKRVLVELDLTSASTAWEQFKTDTSSLTTTLSATVTGIVQLTPIDAQAAADFRAANPVSLDGQVMKVGMVEGAAQTFKDKFGAGLLALYDEHGVPIPVTPDAVAQIKATDLVLGTDENGVLHVQVLPKIGSPEGVQNAEAGLTTKPQNFLPDWLKSSTSDKVTSITNLVQGVEDLAAAGEVMSAQQGKSVVLEQLLSLNPTELQNISTYIAQAMAALSSGTLDAGTEAKVREQLNALLTVVRTADEYLGVGNDISAGIASGLTTYGWTGDATTVATSIETALRAAAQTHSPSAMTRPIGIDLSAGIAAGMMAYGFGSAAGVTAAKAVSALKTELSSSATRPIGLNAMVGMAAGILSGRNIVVNAMKLVAEAAVRAAKAKLKIQSPSKVFRDEVGRMMVRGIGEGTILESKAQARIIQNAARYLTGAAQAGVGGSSSYDNRRTYHQDQSVSVQVDKLYVRDEKDVRSLAIELAQFNKTQYAGMGVR